MVLLLGSSFAVAQERPASPQKTGEIRGTIAYCRGNVGLDVYVPGRSFQARLGTSGHFVFNFVPVGTYALTVDIPGSTSHTITDVVVADNKIIDLGEITICRDNDGDGFTEAVDCNDNNPNIMPSAAESCDGMDNDCDGAVDEGCDLCTDADHDGFYAQYGCLTQVDCNDNDATTRPNGAEACDQRDNNCNGLVDETFDLATDVSNCSSCGNVCSFANAGGACIDGVCTMMACAQGFGDCDENSENGCESDFQTSLTDCGSCANHCTYAHAGATCSGGNCTMGPCDGSFGDCDGAPANGCEVLLSDDPAHCGSCGRDCTTSLHGTATCAESQCVLSGACDNGWGNCDGNAENGCEAYVLSDSLNCGGCGHVCGTTTYVCGSYQCGSYQCNPYACGPFLTDTCYETCYQYCDRYCTRQLYCSNGWCQ